MIIKCTVCNLDLCEIQTFDAYASMNVQCATCGLVYIYKFNTNFKDIEQKPEPEEVVKMPRAIILDD